EERAQRLKEGAAGVVNRGGASLPSAMSTIAVSAGWPEPGQVKTRLSPALPAALACELQAAMLLDTLAAVRASAATRRVLYWADAPANPPGEHGFVEARPHGADLGEGLTAAVEAGLGAGGPVLASGSDAPEITGEGLDAARAALADHDLALGPAIDGGFYLVGLSRRAPRLFDTIAWSTARALEETRAKASEIGLKVAVLEPLAD